MDPAFQDVFADIVDVSGGPYGLTMTFRATDPAKPGDPAAASTVARVRLTPALAKTLGLMLGQAAEQAGVGGSREGTAESA